MHVEVQKGNQIFRISYEDFEEQVRNGEITAQNQIRFEVVTGKDFVAAGDLELFQALADPRQMQFRRDLSRPGVPILTAILVGIQLRIYLSSRVEGMGSSLQDQFSLWAPRILELGESWRLFTYGLLHLSFTHLLFNMCFLAYTGYHLERALGRLNLALLFATSVFFGGLLSLFVSPENPSIGASGGDFGLMAAAVIMGWKYGETIPQHAQKFFGWALLPYLAFSIISGLMASNVDNWSHLGGLVSGITLMTLLDPEVLPRSRRRNRLIRRTVCALMAVISLVLLLSRNRLVPFAIENDVHGWSYPVPSYWIEGWSAGKEPARVSPTGQINISHATRVRHRPVDPVSATNHLISRLRSESQVLRVVSRTGVDRSGWQGEQTTIDHDQRGHSSRTISLILVRGIYEYQVLIRMNQDTTEDYEVLVQRLLDEVDLTEPVRLRKAREARSTAPESWSTGIELAQALHRAGHPHHAMGIWSEALDLQPHNSEALSGWLETQLAYELGQREESAEIALMRSPLDVPVVLLAAEILVEYGRKGEIHQVMNKALSGNPGNESIVEAMEKWGIEIEEFSPE